MLFSPDGNFLQDLLIDEGVAAVDALSRAAVLQTIRALNPLGLALPVAAPLPLAFIFTPTQLLQMGAFCLSQSQSLDSFRMLSQALATWRPAGRAAPNSRGHPISIHFEAFRETFEDKQALLVIRKIVEIIQVCPESS